MGKYINRSIVFVLIQLLTASGYSQNSNDKGAGQLNDVSEMIDIYIAKLAKYKSLNGVVLVSIQDSIIYNKAFGFADISHNIINDLDTRFQVGSVTKPFTAVLVLQLVERGLLSLSDNISEFFPDFPSGNKITIHHLLSHTSGIPQHYTSIDNFFESYDKQFVTRKEMTKEIGGLARESEPGQSFTYTSLGYYVLAAIIEKVSGLSFSEALEKNIFRPAGMNASCIENNKKIIENMAVGYERGINSFIKCNYENKSVFKGAGDLVTTAYDLYLFHQALDYESGLLLKDETKKLLFKPNKQLYGYGFVNYSFPLSNGDTLVLSSHQGGSYGYSAIFDHIPTHDASIIILTNTQTPSALEYREDIGDFLVNSIDQNFPIKEFNFVENEDPDLNKILGLYKLESGSIVSLVKLENRYYYCEPGSLLRALLNQDENSFNLAGPGKFKIKLDYKKKSFDIFRSNIKYNSAVLNIPNNNLSSQYNGNYISDELQKTIKIFVDGKRLIISGFSEKADIAFVPSTKENQFVSTIYRITFIIDDKKNITGFTLFTPWMDQMFGSEFEKL